MESEARAVLRLTDVVKTFPGVVALGGVSLEVVEGEVHALLGREWRGQIDSDGGRRWRADPELRGRSKSAGNRSTSRRPRGRRLSGLSVVYQHTSVLDDLTVAENLLYCVPAVRRCARAEQPSVGARATCHGRRRVRPAHAGERPHRSADDNSSRSPRRWR